MKKGKRVKPIVIDEIDGEKLTFVLEKRVIKGNPTWNIRKDMPGYILKDYVATGHYYEGDIIDLPEREV